MGLAFEDLERVDVDREEDPAVDGGPGVEPSRASGGGGLLTRARAAGVGAELMVGGADLDGGSLVV